MGLQGTRFEVRQYDPLAAFHDHDHHQIVVQQRMARAALHLTDTRMPIAEIAHRVGYGDQSAFSRAFRRHWGETPAAYRRVRA